MNFDNLKSIIEGLVKLTSDNINQTANNNTEDEYSDVSLFFSEDEGLNIMGDIFNYSDKNLDGEIDESEVKYLAEKLEAFNIAGVDINALLGGYFEDTNEAAAADGEPSVSDSSNISDSSSVNNEVDSTTNTKEDDDEENKNPLDKLEEKLNELITDDVLIPDELKENKLVNSQALKDTETRINELVENISKLSPEELKELQDLYAKKDELIKEREEIESEIKEVCSEETKQAIEELEKLREEEAQKQSGNLDITTESEPETTNQSSPIRAGGGSSGSGISGGNVQESNEINTESKTIEELTSELNTENDNLKTQQEELAAILDGSDSKISDLKEAMDEAYKNFQDMLKKVSPELAEELDSAKNDYESKQTNKDEKEKELYESESNVSACERNVDSTQSAVTTFEGIVSELESAVNSETDPTRKSEIQSKLDSAKSELENAKKSKEDAENELEKAEEAKKTAETELDTAEEELEEAEENLDSIEEKISELNNTELDEAQRDYDDARTKLNTEKDSMVSQAKNNITKTENNIKKLENEIMEKSNESVKGQYTLSELKGKYTLNGIEYNTLIDGKALKSLSDKIKSNGAGTGYGHPDTCLSFAFSYGKWVTGTTKTAIGGGAAGYPDAYGYTAISGTKDEILAETKRQLDDGNPVVLHVNGNKKGTSRHYVTVVGYRAGAGSTITESDLLILDSYEGNIEGMKNNGSRFMISGYDTGRTSYDYQIYVLKEGKK